MRASNDFMTRDSNGSDSLSFNMKYEQCTLTLKGYSESEISDAITRNYKCRISSIEDYR